jgi:anthranilate phosphoribosyltransferase
MRNRALSSRTAIELILVNHSARVSKEATAWLATRPENRFTFFFVPLLHPATRLLAQPG